MLLNAYIEEVKVFFFPFVLNCVLLCVGFELVGGWRIRNGMEICCCLLLYLLGKAISCTNRHNCSRLQVKECVMREGYCLSKISNQVFVSSVT